VALSQVRHSYFDRWLGQLPAVVAAEVAALLDYLTEHGRGATLPYVRHRIQISRHYPDMSELRSDHSVDGVRYVMRVLTYFIGGDQEVLVCVGGNKHGWQERTGHDWYDDYCQCQIRSLTVISPEEAHHER
jgi:hypothetical protein